MYLMTPVLERICQNCNLRDIEDENVFFGTGSGPMS
jgi:hypothetical protein